MGITKELSLKIDSYILNNYYSYPDNHQLITALNKDLKLNMALDSLRKRCTKLHLYRKYKKPFEWKDNIKYTEFILNNYNKNKNIHTLTKEFNKHFNLNVSYNAVKGKCISMGFRTERFFSEEENKWLKENYNNYSRKQITKKFNEKFKTDKTEQAIRSHCNKWLNVRFTENQERWLSTVRQKAFERGIKKRPIGSEVFQKGEWRIKLKSGKWISKTRYVNNLPNDTDKKVLVLDHSKPITKENTYVTNSHVLGIMNGNRLHKLPVKLKKVAIKNCELKLVLNETRYL